MIIKTLETTKPELIYQALKLAFRDYFLPLSGELSEHEERWRNAGVDLSLSYGAFVQDKLVGFVLVATKDKDAFNLATGVIPEGRGQGVTLQIFDQLIPMLKSRGFRQMTLEVIDQNKRALKVYHEIGFELHRTLISFSGTASIHLPMKLGSYQVKSLKLQREHLELSTFAPGFEQSFDLLFRQQKNIELHELRIENKLEAFALFKPSRMNLLYLAGTSEVNMAALLGEMKLDQEQWGMINVDSRNKGLISFFQNIGLRPYITQFEMRLAL